MQNNKLSAEEELRIYLSKIFFLVYEKRQQMPDFAKMTQEQKLDKFLETLFDAFVKEGLLPASADKKTTIELVKSSLKDAGLFKNGLTLNDLKKPELNKKLLLCFQFAEAFKLNPSKATPQLMLKMKSILTHFTNNVFNSDQKSLDLKKKDLRLLLEAMQLLANKNLTPANPQMIAKLTEEILKKAKTNAPHIADPSPTTLAAILVNSLTMKSFGPDKEMKAVLGDDNFGDAMGVLSIQPSQGETDADGLEAQSLLRKLTLGDATLAELKLVTTDEVQEENKKNAVEAPAVEAEAPDPSDENRPRPSPLSTKPIPK